MGMRSPGDRLVATSSVFMREPKFVLSTEPVPGAVEISPADEIVIFGPAENRPLSCPTGKSSGRPERDVTKSAVISRPLAVGKIAWSEPVALNEGPSKVRPRPISICSGPPDPRLARPRRVLELMVIAVCAD